MQKLKQFWNLLGSFWRYVPPPRIIPTSWTPTSKELNALSDEKICSLLNACRDYKRKQKGLSPDPDFFKIALPLKTWDFEIKFTEDDHLFVVNGA